MDGDNSIRTSTLVKTIPFQIRGRQVLIGNRIEESESRFEAILSDDQHRLAIYVDKQSDFDSLQDVDLLIAGAFAKYFKRSDVEIKIIFNSSERR